MTKLCVGNLPYTATESQVRDLFERHGDVTSVTMITELETGYSLGVGIVEIEDAGVVDALENLNGYRLGGRSLTVDAAKDKPR